MKADDALWLWVSERLIPVAEGHAPGSETVEERLGQLPSSTREQMSAALRRICLDESPVRVVPDPTVQVQPILRELLRGLMFRRPLAILYRDGRGELSERRVEPQGLLLRPPLWYVLSYDRSRNAGRTLRVDRVKSVTPMLGNFEYRDLDALFETETLRPFET